MLRKGFFLFILGMSLAVGAVYLMNASWLAPESEGTVFVVAHRGVPHNYDRTNLGNFDCTATRIFPPTHEFIENTIPSVGAAFAAGADGVETDIHSTTDDDFAVFHDYTLDCRTDGSGVTLIIKAENATAPSKRYLSNIPYSLETKAWRSPIRVMSPAHAHRHGAALRRARTLSPRCFRQSPFVGKMIIDRSAICKVAPV